MTRNKNVPVTAERIRLLRMQEGLSQAEMGKIIGVSKSSLSEYENGDTKINLDILRKYAEHFHVNMNYLTGSEEGDPRSSVPLFSSVETELILNYRHKSKREQRIIRLQAMSDEEYERMITSHHEESQPAQYLSDHEETDYSQKSEKEKKK